MPLKVVIPARPEPKPKASGPLLSVEQAAVYLGVRSPGTIRNWLSERKLDYVKIGRLTRIRQSVLDRYIEQRTIAAIAPDAEDAE